jgi:putative FmdB family regulatory protein
MPLYEYFCNRCELSFEDLLKKDAPNRKCPRCDSTAHRIISKSSFKINGYSTLNGYSKGKKQND